MDDVLKSFEQRRPAKLNLIDLLKEFVGTSGRPSENPETVTVGVAATRVFRNKPNRLGGIIVNTSPNNIYWALNGNVTKFTGVWILPNGGQMNFDWRKDFEVLTYEMFLIADVAASTIYSMEILSE